MLRGFLRSFSSKLGTGNTRSSWAATFKRCFAIALASLWFFAAVPAAAATVATTTGLAVTSGGSTVTSVASGAKVTLTASVTANGSAVTVGLVNFCDASATYCTDIHLLGSAQLNGVGTAAISLYPGIGSHSYKAVYVGTPGATTTVYLPSVSSPNASLMVTGLYPTATSITNVTGSAPPYSLTAMVTGYVNSTAAAAPAGTVSFLDTSNSNYLLRTSALGASTPGLGFLNSQTAAVSSNPEAIAMGDFNGDGIPDLAVANYGYPGTVTILLGQGDGTFKEANLANLGSCKGSCSPLSAGDGPISVAVGDFNGDGILDLVVADVSGNGSGNGVMVFLGNGDGTFTLKSSPQTTVYPVSVAVGDFNGDGIPDLAVSSECTDPNNCSGTPGVVTILLGNGDGTFKEATGSPITVGADPTHPLLNAQLPDGSRLAAVLPPVVRPNPAVTIRKFSKVRFTIADLIQTGAMTTEIGDLLRGYIEEGKTVLICTTRVSFVAIAWTELKADRTLSKYRSSPVCLRSPKV